MTPKCFKPGCSGPRCDGEGKTNGEIMAKCQQCEMWSGWE